MLAELKAEATSSIEIEGDRVAIKHMYIERRMQQLNLYLEESTRDNAAGRMRNALHEYGAA